jgi:signal recognition particle receptor subunit beta
MQPPIKNYAGLSRDGNTTSAPLPYIGPQQCAGQQKTLSEIVQKFALSSLLPVLHECEALARAEPLHLTVLGQFKSGKSSLLNAILGESILPVGVLPVTAVVTRVTGASDQLIRVTYFDGTVEEFDIERLADFVTEAGNPRNRRSVAVVDVLTPSISDLPDIRLVDTPGLGSLYAHNTEATRCWMPHIAAAIVTVSSERPLSHEDLTLIEEARRTAPRVIVVLTKVDLLTDAEREPVVDFLLRSLREKFEGEPQVIPFSARADTARWLGLLRDALLVPVSKNVAAERQATLALKLSAVTQSCRDYLSLAIQAAQRSDAERARLRAAVFNEKVNLAVIHDELSLAEQGIRSTVRPALEAHFLKRHRDLEQRVTESLTQELRSWRGNLAQQARRYETWMKERLTAELAPCSRDAAKTADSCVTSAEERFRRIVEAFRDRLNRNVREATGIAISPLAWEPKRPELASIPINVGHTFMVHWELLWWMLPMKLVGRLFRKHALAQVPREVDTNLRRLVSDWAGVVDKGLADLRHQAMASVDAELATLDRLLDEERNELSNLHRALHSLDTTCSTSEAR